MGTRIFGERITRNEDGKLLTGRALFVDDIHLPDMAHAALLRSSVAHGLIRRIDVQAARAHPGVLAVYTADDLGETWATGPVLVPAPPIAGAVFNARTQVPLAKGKVRHVGEPLAIVIAESRAVAEDALALIECEIDQLPVVGDLEVALLSDAPRVHEDVEANLAAHVRQAKGDYAQAAARAHRTFRRRLTYDHGASCPMETRGIVAQWEPRAEQLTIWDTTQAPVFLRGGLATWFGLEESQVRVIAPFIGGGFGPKIMLFYPEEILIPFAAMRLRRPVKWIEDRLEHFVATTHERSQIHDAEIAVDIDGHILGVKDEFLFDTGAYNPYGLTIPINSQCTLLGPYVIPAYDSTFRSVFTNRTLVTPYRGAGRQHGVFVIERLLDVAARELGIDRAEIRRRNLIPVDAFPYNNEIIYQDFAALEYDSGNYQAVLARALEMIGYEDFRRTQLDYRARGRHLGLGVVCYVEGTGIGPYEGARVQVTPNSRAHVVTGIGTQGQGHYTIFAQIVAEQLGMNVSDVDVVTGDTDRFSWGAGTFASRGAVVAGNAVNEAAKRVRQRVLETASDFFECSPNDLVIEAGRVAIAGVPERSITLGELARMANPMRGAVKADAEPGLEATRYFGPPKGATSNGVHAVIVEIDPETCDLKIQKYVVVHDCGTLINPLIVEGQVRGGVAQGIGNAYFEHLIYNQEGQLLTASLADYLLPTSNEIPRIEIDHVVTPSPLNPLGVKGVGEAGAIPGGALFAQAIEDALNLPARGVELNSIPLSPSQLWELMNPTPDPDRTEMR